MNHMRVLALTSFALACAGCGGAASPSPTGLTVDPSVSARIVVSGLGVDGLAFDPTNPSIVVPDSPNGYPLCEKD